MSSDVLRRAAALMRENASTAEPGRWKLWGMTVMADPLGTSNVDDALDVAQCHTPSTTDRLLHTGNAEHIASWHPAVALAVADLLDRHADGYDGDEAEPGTYSVDQDDFADRVARAYLGETEPTT